MARSKPLGNLFFQLLATAFIVAGLTGAAHALSDNEAVAEPDLGEYFDGATQEAGVPASSDESPAATGGPDTNQETDTNPQPHPLAGTWSTPYEDTEFTGFLLIELRGEGDNLRGFAVAVGDDTGTLSIDEELVFSVTSFDGESGAGIYYHEEAGERYDVPTTLQLLDDDHLQVSWDYAGEAGTELWRRAESR